VNCSTSSSVHGRAAALRPLETDHRIAGHPADVHRVLDQNFELLVCIDSTAGRVVEVLKEVDNARAVETADRTVAISAVDSAQPRSGSF
jgi:hypothetical protein